MGLLMLVLPLLVENQTDADLIELNHVYRGNHWFTQWVVWDWYSDGYHVRDWAPDKGIKLRRRGAFVELTKRNEVGGFWRVSASQFRETWTEKDVEVEDRDILPISYRCLIWTRH